MKPFGLIRHVETWLILEEFSAYLINDNPDEHLPQPITMHRLVDQIALSENEHQKTLRIENSNSIFLHAFLRL